MSWPVMFTGISGVGATAWALTSIIQPCPDLSAPSTGHVLAPAIIKSATCFNNIAAMAAHNHSHTMGSPNMASHTMGPPNMANTQFAPPTWPNTQWAPPNMAQHPGPAVDTSGPAAITSSPAAIASGPAANTSDPNADTSGPSAITFSPNADTSGPNAITFGPNAINIGLIAINTTTPDIEGNHGPFHRFARKK
ncbi:uncharacterized protein O3C94_007654 [Discoglossus pictus]